MKTENAILRSADSQKLHARVHAVRTKRVLVTVATGAALALAVFVVVFGVEMIADWLFELSWPVRCAVLILNLGAEFFVSWRFAIQPYLHRPNDDSIALQIERAMPEFRSRFIASIQLARLGESGVSEALVKALLAETAAMAARLDFRSVVKMKRLHRAAAITAGMFVVAVSMFAWSGHASVTLIKRSFLSHDAVPRKTQIGSITGDTTVGLGDDLKIEVTAQGVIPSSGQLVVKSASGLTHEFSLEADPAVRGRFSRMLKSVQEPLTYSVQLGDSTTQFYQINALPRPAIVSLECEQVCPAYTKLGSVRRTPGDLTLLAGSRLNLKVKASRNIKEAEVFLAGVETKIPLSVNPLNRSELTGTVPIPAKDLTGFSIHLVDDHGIASRDPATYRIDLVPDKPPTVKITFPNRREELITSQGSMLIGFEASDDFGIAKATLHYAVNGESGGSEKTVELDLAGQRGKTLDRRFEWKIGALNPRPPIDSTLDYWFEVSDTNDVTGPGTAASEHFQAKIVSTEDKLADLSNRLMNSLGGLDEIATNQEQLNQKLGTVIFAKPGP